jgi:hypothetical protein
MTDLSVLASFGLYLGGVLLLGLWIYWIATRDDRRSADKS